MEPGETYRLFIELITSIVSLALLCVPFATLVVLLLRPINAKPGLCAGCGYSHHGIPEQHPCPECGKSNWHQPDRSMSASRIATLYAIPILVYLLFYVPNPLVVVWPGLPALVLAGGWSFVVAKRLWMLGDFAWWGHLVVGHISLHAGVGYFMYSSQTSTDGLGAGVLWLGSPLAGAWALAVAGTLMIGCVKLARKYHKKIDNTLSVPD